MTETQSHAGPSRLGIVGDGRLGRALVAALRELGQAVHGPARRGEIPRGEVLLLCVPDQEIETAAAAVAGHAPFVGHTSGAMPLSALQPAARAGAAVFGLHPLQTMAGAPSERPADSFRGVGCAVAGSTPEALAVARSLAERLGMRALEIDDSSRAAYHAAASISSNFLVTLQAAAERLAAAAGLEAAEARSLIAPLARRSLENWAALGPEAALTGPVARGDERTVELQREAVAKEAPELLRMFDELVALTRALARTEVAA